MAQKYNALVHGLFAKEALLPFEDRRKFSRFCRDIINSLNPENEIEGHFARDIAEGAWKIQRMDLTIGAQRQKIYERLSPKMVAQFADIPESLHKAAPHWLSDMSSKVTKLEKKFYMLVCTQYEDCLKNYVGIPNLVAVYKQYPQLFLCASNHAEQAGNRAILNSVTNSLDAAWQQNTKALWGALEVAYQYAYFFAHWDRIRKLAIPWVQSWFYLEAAQSSRLEHHQALALKARGELRKQMKSYEGLKKNAPLFSKALLRITQSEPVTMSKPVIADVSVMVGLSPMHASVTNVHAYTQTVMQ